jgi:hypothetical protein
VNQVQRWPSHPAPREGECLSSWLQRVADCYQMSAKDLMEYELGHVVSNHINMDIQSPAALLTMLSQRSGFDLARLRRMSFIGWTDWVLECDDNQLPVALDKCDLEISLLLPKSNRKRRGLVSWQACIPGQPIRLACPSCLNDGSSDQSCPLLMWEIPLLLSCPRHGCWLESCWGFPSQFHGWKTPGLSPRMANEAISKMDQYTWQALALGYVELPRRRIHAGIWLRLLRALLDELNTPLSQCGACAGDIRQVWERSGHPLRAGQTLWRPFELLKLQVQLQMLEAAATAIDLIESQVLTPRGPLAKLFIQCNKLPMNEMTHDATVWQTAITMEQLRVRFAEAGIPLEYLPYCAP